MIRHISFLLIIALSVFAGGCCLIDPDFPPGDVDKTIFEQKPEPEYIDEGLAVERMVTSLSMQCNSHDTPIQVRQVFANDFDNNRLANKVLVDMVLEEMMTTDTFNDRPVLLLSSFIRKTTDGKGGNVMIWKMTLASPDGKKIYWAKEEKIRSK